MMWPMLCYYDCARLCRVDGTVFSSVLPNAIALCYLGNDVLFLLKKRHAIIFELLHS